MLRTIAVTIIAAAAAAASLAQAQEPIPFVHGHRDGACFAAFDAADGAPGRLELSFDVAKKQFSARIDVPRWTEARASAAGKSVPLTLTLNNGFTTTVAAHHAEGTAAEARAKWEPKEPSWALFRALNTANSARLSLGGRDAATFSIGRSSLLYETLIYCMDDVEKGRVS